MTDAEIDDMLAYWTLPPKERDARFGTWPIRVAADDIRALCEDIATRQHHACLPMVACCTACGRPL